MPDTIKYGSKVWHVWYGDKSHDVQLCEVKADHFLLLGDQTVVFYKGVDEEEAVAIFTSVVYCTLDGVVP